MVVQRSDFALAALSLAVALLGAGSWSLDARLKGIRERGQNGRTDTRL